MKYFSKIGISIITLFTAVMSCYSQSASLKDSLGGAPVPSEIQNPELLGINKEKAHASLMPYANINEALAANRHASTYCRSLNGMWKFNWVSWPQMRPVDFYKPDYSVAAWKEIPVPSNCKYLDMVPLTIETQDIYLRKTFQML